MIFPVSARLENHASEWFFGIIKQLEAQKAAIERALAALRVVDQTEAPASAAPNAHDRRSGSQRERWAAKKSTAVSTEA
jgi:hypothetical protein